ncbi:PGF-CTERM sorting domain-containing protein [Halomontanus rarus]|uniref:PGF-CTERM sorting domain-containing protein n=1 Tax=Halomontanus rarus TaxID=3034020 RepID=UPI001F611DD4
MITVGLCLLVSGLATAGAAAGTDSVSTSTVIDTAEYAGIDGMQDESEQTDGGGENATDGANTDADAHADVRNPQPPIEDEYVEEAPERGDEYFEAIAADGRWISYTNPRDRYRSPYLGEGSGKICMTLVNEEGEQIVGETVPNTTVTIPTSDSIDWHSYAGPMTVDLPLTEHYERPYDADQFGTSDLPQGDGYMDAHCIEIHGMPEDGGHVGYDEPRIDGEYADWIEVAGYVQTQDTWDSDIDPVEAAEPYEEAGGWTYAEGDSHGQVVIVLQLDPPADAYPDAEETVTNETGADADTEIEDADTELEAESNGTETDDADEESEDADDERADENDGAENETVSASEDDEASSNASQMPGFGVFVALAALAGAILARGRR